MNGIGTIINTLAVIAGTGIGILFKSGINEKIRNILMQTCGVAVIFMGLAGTLSKMITIENGTLQIQGTMLLILSLVLGGFIGQLLDIERKLDRLGEGIKKRVNANDDNQFVDGFVNTSLIICVGALAIVGSIQDGLNGDFSMLVAKSILDFVIVIVFASTYGLGVLFSALSVFIYQGTITFTTIIVGPLLGDVLIDQLSFVGSSLIFCVGINIAFGNKFNVGNMLPALLGPIFYALFTQLCNII